MLTHPCERSSAESADYLRKAANALAVSQLELLKDSAVSYNAGGFEDWVVNCSCGTKVDDGERMVECEVCNVWLHTRCQGIPDADSIPDDFVCSHCSTLQSYV